MNTVSKLLYVHDRFGAFAGAETNILATAREFQQRGASVGILHGSRTGKGEDLWNDAFEFCCPLRNEHSVVNAIEMFDPDALFIHNLSDPDLLETLSAADRPVVRMVHDHNLYCPRSYKYNYFSRRPCTRALSSYCIFPCGALLVRDREGRFPFKWVDYSAKQKELRTNRKFDRLVVATQFMKDELVRNGFAPERIEIHSPVPPDADTTCSNFSDRNVIIYSGQITRGKGVDVLLESLALVGEDFECLIFGDGNHRAHCEKLGRKLGLEDRVHFMGYVPQAEIAAYYRDCSVVVMSSVWPEPFGAAGLEGMRHGLPVVAFDAGGIKEWLSDGVNGFLVPWMDRTAYAERIERLLRDKPLAREMGEWGRRRAAESFSFARYMDGLEGLFERVVGKSEALVFA